ncbi:MAG: DUF4905 domain-containing protein [Melioribacteraceae bacterium]
MKIEKLFSYKSPGQIWRIQISDNDRLVVETRDLKTKEVFFHCFELDSGKVMFEDLQLDEKNYIGIETIHKNIIYFHKYPQRDMPGHKEIIAFDIDSRKVLWENRDLSFLFALGDLIYGFQQGFEDRCFFALNYLSGEMIKEYGNDYKTINIMRRKADDEIDWNNYRYPKVLSKEEENERIAEVIASNTQNLLLEGDVEYNCSGNLLCFNFHSKIFEGSYLNRFMAVNLNGGGILLDEVLNLNAPTLFADSFFIYKNYLFLLREKNEVIVYTMEA